MCSTGGVMGLRVLLSLLLLVALAATAEAEEVTLAGFVTSAGTNLSFEVDGRAVLCDPASTLLLVQQGNRSVGTRTCPQHSLGEPVTLTGPHGRAGDPFRAATVTTVVLEGRRVSGTALILRVPGPDAHGATSVVADGYVLDIDAGTKVLVETGDGPSVSPFRPNFWIKYAGLLQPNGRVRVTSAQLWLNNIDPSEANLRRKGEFDPAQVSEDDRQAGMARVLFGVNEHRLPAFDDPTALARINAIGARLVPHYQRALAAADPTRINFRFGLIDEPQYAYWPLASGIILVSHQALQTLKSDDQVAALLALGMADVLQKEQLRARSERRLVGAAALAGDAAGLLIPGAGLVTSAAGFTALSSMQQSLLEARARVSLELLHDAGFDPGAVPQTLWTLSQKEGKTLQQTTVPPLARYSYEAVYRLYTQPGAANAGAPAGQSEVVGSHGLKP